MDDFEQKKLHFLRKKIYMLVNALFTGLGTELVKDC